MKLGRTPHDPQLVALAPQLDTHPIAQMIPPASLVQPDDNWMPGLYCNDALPDCTAVALANTMRSFASLQGASIDIDDSYVPIFYGDTIDMPGASLPVLAATGGANMLSVLQYQRVHGFQIGPLTPPYSPRPMFADFGSTDPRNRIIQACVIWKFGAAYWGIKLTQNDMDKFQAGEDWDDDGSDTSPVIGGHAIPGRSYEGLGDTEKVTVFTWGQRQKATWRWLMLRLEESYGVIWQQLMLSKNTTDAALDYDRLADDCRAWSLAA